jgi:hypothetical protein
MFDEHGASADIYPESFCERTPIYIGGMREIKMVIEMMEGI